MPQIIPIRDLKNTNAISQRCHDSKEPIYITKNGYGDMVIMSMETYERQCALADIFAKLGADEAQIQAGQGRLLAELLDETRIAYCIGSVRDDVRRAILWRNRALSRRCFAFPPGSCVLCQAPGRMPAPLAGNAGNVRILPGASAAGQRVPQIFDRELCCPL